MSYAKVSHLFDSVESARQKEIQNFLKKMKK
jgi:hypothetical protein